MHADSAFIRRLTIVRDQGEAWSARFRPASPREGFGATLARLLVAIPVLLVVGFVLLATLIVAVALGMVAIAAGLVVAAARWVRRTLGLGPAASREREFEHPERVNVRVIRRS